jgi:hypothetical protein
MSTASGTAADHRIACHRVSDAGVPDFSLPNEEKP